MIWKFLHWVKNSDSFIARILFKILLFVYERILWWFITHYIYDSFRFFRYSAWVSLNTVWKYDSTLIKEYHKIEKWLTYPNFRPYFWKKVIEHIFDIIDSYWKKYWLTHGAKIALNTIHAYIEHHKKNDFTNEYITSLEEKFNTLLSQYEYSVWESFEWWILEVKKHNILKELPENPEKFFNSRYSIRDFEDSAVDISLIEKAIDIARKTPSVCNRQSWKAYLLTKKEDILNALKYQNGNSWFNTKIDKLLIITTDLSCFHIGTERYQNWIDGWMFAMSVVYWLHAVGLWSCCLNWSAYFYNDMKVRKTFPIQKNESIIMMIAVGNIPEKLKVTQSPRKELNDFLVTI